MTTFTGDGNANTANATNGTLSGFTGGTAGQLTDGSGDLINGLGGDDTIIGGDANDTINGGDNNDLIGGGNGFDSLDGGNGIDTHTLTHFNGGTSWNMTTGVVTFVGFVPTETAVNFENAILGNGDDTIIGTAGANFIIGNGGADDLQGGQGNDTLEGGAGFDLLEGGAGNDSLSGGSEAEQFNYTSQADLTGDTIDGGTQEGGLDILLVGAGPGPMDFSTATIASTGTTSIEGLRFGAVFGGGAIFRADQFSNTGVSTALRLEGPGVAADLTINNVNGAFSASAFTFNTWVASSNRIIINGGTTNDTITGSTETDRIFGGSGNDQLTGGLGNDLLDGGIGDDTLTMDAGVDSMVGDAGNDTFTFSNALDSAGDTIDGGTDNGGDGDTMRVGTGGASNLTGITFQSVGTTSIERLLLGGQNHVVTLDASQFGTTAISTALTIRSLVATPGDVVVINNANGAFNASQFGFHISWNAAGDRIDINGGTGQDTLTGTVQRDSISGNGDDDDLFGGGGDDTLIGGLGEDILVGGAGADSLVGGDDADYFTYASANDLVFSEFAPEVVDGGGQTDRIVVNFAGTIDLSKVLFQSSGTTSIEMLVLNGVGNAVLLDAGQFSATGIAAALFIRGNNAGLDIVTINNANGTFDAGAFTFDAWTADRMVINGGTGADTITGTTQADSISGGTGNDALDGGLQNDTLQGAAGRDLINGGDGDDSIFGNTEAAPNGSSDGDTLSGDEGNDVVAGADGADALFGGIGNDTLVGYAESDSIYGGAGDDSMLGASGNDHYVVNDLGDITVESAANGEDTSWVGVSGWTNGLEIEIVRMFGSAASVTGSGTNEQLVANAGLLVGSALDGSGGDDVLWGSAFADTLTGGEGNDIFRGGAGADSMIGGNGVDIFVVNDLGDVIVELAGGGYDTAYITVDNYVLPASGGAFAANLEVAYLAGTATVLNGSSSGENMVANPTAGSVLAGFGGNDILYGSNFGDSFTGGTGGDQMQGFGGGDQFRFVEAAWGQDIIWDFATAQGDKLVFSAASGVTAFGQLTQGMQGGWLLLGFGGNSILLNGVTGITAADVVFV